MRPAARAGVFPWSMPGAEMPWTLCDRKVDDPSRFARRSGKMLSGMRMLRVLVAAAAHDQFSVRLDQPLPASLL